MRFTVVVETHWWGGASVLVLHQMRSNCWLPDCQTFALVGLVCFSPVEHLSSSEHALLHSEIIVSTARHAPLMSLAKLCMCTVSMHPRIDDMYISLTRVAPI